MESLIGWLQISKSHIVLAYIDAGTGSLILQVIIGSLAGGILALKLSWRKLKGVFKKSQSGKQKIIEGSEKSVEE